MGIFINQTCFIPRYNIILRPTGSEERGVFKVGSIPVAILPSCQHMKTIALKMHNHEYGWVVKIRNTSEAIFRQQYILGYNRRYVVLGQYHAIREYCGPHTAS